MIKQIILKFCDIEIFVLNRLLSFFNEKKIYFDIFFISNEIFRTNDY